MFSILEDVNEYIHKNASLRLGGKYYTPVGRAWLDDL
jgi:hypothetical protein